MSHRATCETRSRTNCKSSLLRSIYWHLLVFAFLFGGELASGSSPNILLIVSEDNGPELACYGDRHANTPHLDQLASEGILFQRAFVPQAGCSQSRASFLTGLYPHQHGQLGLATWGFRMYREDTPNLPRRLKAIGYRTGLIGKLHINPAGAFPFDMHKITSSNFNRSNLRDYARYAAEFIGSDAAPFFLSVNYPDAHDPWIRQVEGLPEKPLSPDQIDAMDYMGLEAPALRCLVADYYNCLSRLDSMIGDLLSVLEESGKAQNTIVVYIGDHGADMLRGKRTCYEGGLRIPMLIRWPTQIVPQVRAELVSTLDLLPTLLKATGAEPIEGVPGSELQPLFQSDSAPWRSYFCAEYHTHAAASNYFPQRSIRGDRYKLIESLLPETIHPDCEGTIKKLQGDFASQKYPGTLNLTAIIAAATPEVRKAYEQMRCPPKYQLYDLQLDPYEFHNVAGDPDYADILEDLKSRLTQWRTETNDPLLDPKKLDTLTSEVRSVKKKSEAKKHTWAYPEYLFAD